MFGNKKGIYYTMDAVLSGFLLVAILVLLLTSDLDRGFSDQENYLARDLMNGLDTLKISDLNDDFINQEISNGNITDVNKSVLDAIGFYWATNQSSKASQLFDIATQDFLFQDLGFKLLINDDEILVKEKEGSTDNIFVSTRMVSGIDREVPLEGASASIYLRRLSNKKSSSYAYLGGFVGQGNITFTGEALPEDITEESIEAMYLEGDFSDNFEFFINNQSCEYNDNDVFSVNSLNLSVDSWYLDDCFNLIEPGVNEFGFVYSGSLENSYVSGGLIRIDYRTNELQEETSYGKDTYSFPTITGLANLFDSFYIPGQLTSMNVNLNYETNDSAYITIGERIIYINDEEGNLQEGVIGNVTENDIKQFNVTLTNEFLLENHNLDYNQLSDNTVPLRFAAYETSKEVIKSGDADVIIISDYSRSMMRAIDNWGMGNRRSNCEDALADSETRRTDLATCLNKEFADNILNFTGNRLWPVYMYDNDIEYYNNPQDLDAIKGFMESFSNGRGESCIACAMNQAYEILEQHSNESRKKFIVVMTDGVPTHCADGSCSSEAVIYGTQQCSGICNQAGNCPSSQREDQCQECVDNPLAGDNLFYSSERAVDDLNTTIFSIGFGPFENECSLAGSVLSNVANIGGGTYQHSEDNEDLQLIYQNVSMEILTMIDQQNQTVNIKKGEVESNLLGGEINFYFDPIIPPLSPSMISVVLEEPLTSCNNTIEIPTGLTVADAKVTSYSGPHWSDLVVSNEITVFNLSDYYVPYPRLGDPFNIQVPVNTLVEGENNIFVETGDSHVNRTGCSEYDKFIYTALVPSATTRTDVKEISEGCQWTVDFEDGDQQRINVPTDYEGSNTCSYQPGNIVFNQDDTYDVAMHDLLSQLDTNDDGRVLININELDLEFATTLLEDIPYLWGPALVRLEVWT